MSIENMDMTRPTLPNLAKDRNSDLYLTEFSTNDQDTIEFCQCHSIASVDKTVLLILYKNMQIQNAVLLLITNQKHWIEVCTFSGGCLCRSVPRLMIMVEVAHEATLVRHQGKSE